MPFPSDLNLVACKREAWPRLDPMVDLTRNVTVARQLLRELDGFFHFRPECAYFSGFTRPSDDPEAPFYVQFWDDDGELYRSVAFKGVGYTGVLNVDPNEVSLICEAMGTDWVGAAYYGFDDMRYIVDGYQRNTLCLVQGDTLTVHLPWNP